jgi:hypothetical protein
MLKLNKSTDQFTTGHQFDKLVSQAGWLQSATAPTAALYKVK